ncbi:glycoside hydrolase family 1 protein [Candidatus Enterococcus murrayae]|uniref:Glycoside hydrolase family 1 protein n=1 Tax=Candidatus Enterococcus murrayae TaxID=2815321 RepID=A0ABS3HKC5_9ENTE|nr:glycoside hydrolase family 1 protein [Enterococcus sp. MJM16]MBO0453909.1 glycoside hydrolase family 1 protein [Enterococcus sp. MJM16]
MKNFPDNFLWGAAMSAPQTEGQSLNFGKAATTWDYWFHTAPEKFHQNQGPEITSGVYDHYLDDCRRMQDIGLNSLRTSISWARLLPDGKTINQEAVDFYRQFFSAMLDHGIETMINLFHFDMPMWLMDQGGWENRRSIEAFAFYAKTSFELFGDLVKKWTTFNEPIVHVECGYLYQYHYPAIVDFRRAIQVAYHTLLAHKAAVKIFREVTQTSEIGIILNISPTYPRSEVEEDVLAAFQSDLLNTRSFLDPAVLGTIPEELTELLAEHDLLPEREAGDHELIKENLVDFIGLNYYQPRRVQAPIAPKKPAEMPADFYAAYDWPDKKMNPYRGWEIYPEALYDVALMMKKEYNNIPWYVSENGMGVADEERFMNDSGEIEDDYRIEFMKEHLSYLHQGIVEGSNCFGYHAWTFVDCWSWLNGYKNRYGFYRLDLDTLERSMKKSGRWMRAVSEKNGF